MFQIYITQDEKSIIPDRIIKCIASVNNLKGEFEHYLLRGEQVRSIINNNLGREVLNAYDNLKPFAFKADLARYCMIYIFGGWYYDVSCAPKSELKTPGAAILVFKDAPTSGNGGINMQNGVFYGVKGHDLFRRLIERIIFNVKTNFYGNNPLDITGPGLFGSEVAKSNIDDIIFGNYLPLTPMHNLKNFAFILPDGEIHSYGKYTAGTPLGDGLSSLGVIGGNSYGLMWATGDVYNNRN